MLDEVIAGAVPDVDSKGKMRLALCLRPLAALDQEQKSGSPGGEARGRGGVGQLRLLMNADQGRGRSTSWLPTLRPTACTSRLSCSRM
jgi:hypothetical protein